MVLSECILSPLPQEKKKGSQEFINVLRIYSSQRETDRERENERERERERGRRQTVLLQASVSCVIHTPTTQHVNSISLDNLGRYQSLYRPHQETQQISPTSSAEYILYKRTALT